MKLPPNFTMMARALFRPLSEPLAAEALDKLHTASSPRNDGMCASIYKKFHSSFIPTLHEIALNSFAHGLLPTGWERGPINCIPKASGLAAISKLRPIALQDGRRPGRGLIEKQVRGPGKCPKTYPVEDGGAICADLSAP